MYWVLHLLHYNEIYHSQLTFFQREPRFECRLRMYEQKSHSLKSFEQQDNAIVLHMQAAGLLAGTSKENGTLEVNSFLSEEI
jgi:hypothetical protein